MGKKDNPAAADNTEGMDSQILANDLFAGSLRLKSGGKGWKPRYCALNKDVALLSVYRSQSDRLRGRRQKCFHLTTSAVDKFRDTRTQFALTDAAGRTSRFKAESKQLRDKWLDHIRQVVNMHSALNHQRASKGSKSA